MCTTCGCSNTTHDHGHSDSVKTRLIKVEEDLLARNQNFAENNRTRLKQTNTYCFNLVSSPGSGKTTLLVATIDQIKDELKSAVIEGDQQTDNDTQRIKATGVPATQINTGKGCHLDAHAIGHALDTINYPDKDIVFVENVGNLVCPAAFDLGEHCKVVILSVTEGEDKPLKYPDMFRASALMLINKADLLPYLDFDLDKCIEYAKRINPQLEVITLSAKTGEGMEQWIDWLKQWQASK